MSHGNAVINGNGVEFGGIAAKTLYLGLDNLSGFVQMGVPWHELGERIGYGNDRLAELFLLHAVGDPKGAGCCHTPAFSTLAASEWNFHNCLIFISKKALLFVEKGLILFCLDITADGFIPMQLIDCKNTNFFELVKLIGIIIANNPTSAAQPFSGGAEAATDGMVGM